MSQNSISPLVCAGTGHVQAEPVAEAGGRVEAEDGACLGAPSPASGHHGA